MRAAAGRVRVCLGGTFDRLHAGHELLLRKAFEVGDEVFIGVTSQRLAQARRQRVVQPLAARLRGVQRLLRRHGWKGAVSEIDHPFGRSTEARYDAIVVSPETRPRTVEINRARRRKGLRPLKVIPIPFVYSEDGLRLTATRIAEGDVDGRGRRLTPVRVCVGTDNRLKSAAVRDAFRRAFPRLRVQARQARVHTGVPEQPVDSQTFKGAFIRAREAMRSWPRADYGVGVEAGLIADRDLGRHLDVQYVVVADRQGSTSAAHGGGFYYPRHLTREVLGGRTVSQVLGPVAGDPRLGSTRGAVGFLSRGAIDRRELTAHAVLLALLPRIRRDLYQE